MVDKVTLQYVDQFYALGELVHSDFAKLFSLEELLASSYDYVLGYFMDSQLVGFIHFTKLYEIIDIVNLVVDESYRGQGIATTLLGSVFSMFDDVTSILLEVNEKNQPAIQLYLKNHFYEINRREHYYGNDTAIIMKRDVE